MIALRLFCLISIVALVACEKKDTVMTPEQEAEYQRMLQKNLREHPQPSYEELKRENEELKDKEIERAMEK